MTRPGTPAFDAIILGAGPAGASAALTLARLGRRVALIDRPASHPVPVGESLPPAARLLLSRLGVMDLFLAGPYLACYGGESAWGGDRLHVTDSLRDPYGHGWHLDRAAFDALLRDAAQDAGAALVSLSAPAAVSRASNSAWRVTATSADGRPVTLAAPWLIDGTGRRSLVARGQGVRRVRFDRLVGHAATFRLPSAESSANDPAQTTLVESAPEGWWYTARVPDGSRVVVYLTDADTETGRLARRPAGMEILLRTTRHIRERLRTGGFESAGAPRIVAAHTARLERCAGDGWVTAGDAALSLDPLSSQGLFHALASGIEAGQTVAACLGGHRSALDDYERSQTSVFATYLKHRADFYGLERRWPDSPFWRRRHADPTAALGGDAARWGTLGHA